MIVIDNLVCYLDLPKQKKRKLGIIDGKTFIAMPRKKSRHLFKKLNAWGASYNLLQTLKELGVEEFMIPEKENKETYSISIDKYLKDGTVMKFGNFETQVFVPVDKFEIIGGIEW